MIICLLLLTNKIVFVSFREEENKFFCHSDDKNKFKIFVFFVVLSVLIVGSGI